MDPLHYVVQASQAVPSHAETLHGHDVLPWMADPSRRSPHPWPAQEVPLLDAPSSRARVTFRPPPSLGSPATSTLPRADGRLPPLHSSDPCPAPSARPSNLRETTLPAVPAAPPAASSAPPEAGRASRSRPGDDTPASRPWPASEPGLPAAMPSPTRPAAAASNGLGRGPPGATDDAHSPSFSLPDRLLVADDQLAPPHRAENLPHFHTSAPRRARGQGSYPSSALSMPSAPPQLQSTTSPMPPARILSGLPSPSSIGRRRQGYSRSRRYMNARQTASDPVRDADDQDFRHAAEHGSLGRADRLEGYGHGHGSAQPWDEMAVRQLQIARGSAPSKLVASRTALQSLQSVDVRELSGSEKTCVICYNDYGVESPEGINEAPLRLPRCRHVFGDHCIKKWFDDSDSCPYCRDKLPSEPKQQLGNARLFMNTMRMRGGPLPAGLPEHMVTRIVAGSIGDLELLEAVARQSRPVERRSPPEDSAAEDQRRTRQRRTAPALNLPSRTVSSFNDDDAATRPRIVPHNLAAAGQQRPRSTLLPAQSQPNRRPARQPRPVGRSESRFAPSAPYLAPSSAAGAQANPVQFQQANRAFDHDRWRGVPPLGGGIPLLNPLQSPGRAPSASFFGILAHSGRSPSNLGPAQGGHGSAPPRGNAPGAAEPAAAAPPPSSLFGDAASSSYRHRPW